jgi:predicted membrane channel-forming protein YqfA (hemolysin III family)
MFLVWHIFDPEVGGYTFLRNVGSYMDYTAIYLLEMAAFVTVKATRLYGGPLSMYLMGRDVSRAEY